MFSLPASVLVFEAFVVLEGLRFCGTFALHLNWTEAVTSLSFQKLTIEKNVVSDLGREQKGRFGASALKVGCHLYLTHRCLSVIYIYSRKSGYMLLPNPNLPFISFVPIQNGYKQLPNPPGTPGFACQYWCLLPWWWGCQEASTHKSRGKVLRGYSISRQTVIVCKVKISGN